jgi:hypothetical protein
MDSVEIDMYGNKYWYRDGVQHRDDGPAIEFANGSKVWRIHGKLHREDGPAVEHIHGSKYWYYHDKAIDCENQEEFERIIKMKAFW